MRLALYSPRPALLERQWEILEEFNSTACLDLDVRSFGSYDVLLREAAQCPFDVLFYDTQSCSDPGEALLQFRRLLPHCPQVLLGGSADRVGLQAVEQLTLPLDGEEYLALLIHLIREARYG